MSDAGIAAIQAALAGVAGDKLVAPATTGPIPATAAPAAAAMEPAAVENPQNAPKKEAPKVVDYDQGFQGWGTESVALLHPFKTKGVFYEAISVRVPTGADMARHIMSRQPITALIENLTPIDDILMGAMHGSDYARVVDVVGEYLAGVR